VNVMFGSGGTKVLQIIQLPNFNSSLFGVIVQ